MNQARSNASIRPLEERDFQTVAQLARTIWLEHYITIITKEQIEYMLDGRFSPENLRSYLAGARRWMDVLELDGELVGYCSYSLTNAPGEMKLEQIYLLPRLHGRGLGRHMLEHVERRAAREGCSVLMLTVNKLNDKAIRVYRAAGFSIREAVVFDIGRGFVMDDYVMAKQLAG
ncbi:MAG TPA: GNAT family N-acetyltransferase [Steroidobacteraceae bacterium]